MQVLYLNQQGWLEFWLRHQLGCTHQAADLLQDTFEQSLRAAANGKLPDIAEPQAYLAVVAKRVLFNFWRRRDPERAYVDASIDTLAEAYALANKPPVGQIFNRNFLPPKAERMLPLN